MDILSMHPFGLSFIFSGRGTPLERTRKNGRKTAVARYSNPGPKLKGDSVIFVRKRVVFLSITHKLGSEDEAGVWQRFATKWAIWSVACEVFQGITAWEHKT
jgi:hypothetical protein